MSERGGTYLTGNDGVNINTKLDLICDRAYFGCIGLDKNVDFKVMHKNLGTAFTNGTTG